MQVLTNTNLVSGGSITATSIGNTLTIQSTNQHGVVLSNLDTTITTATSGPIDAIVTLKAKITKQQEKELVERIYNAMIEVHLRHNIKLSAEQAKAISDHIDNSPEEVKKIYSWLKSQNRYSHLPKEIAKNTAGLEILSKKLLPVYSELKSIVETKLAEVKFTGCSLEELEKKLKDKLANMFQL